MNGIVRFAVLQGVAGLSTDLPAGRLTGYCMEMQLDILSFVWILSAIDPEIPQVLVFGGGLLLLAIPVIVLRVRPFAISVWSAIGAIGPFISLLVICGGLSGSLFSYELVRSYGFSPLWRYALPAVSAASVYFQYTSCKYPLIIQALSNDNSSTRRSAAAALGRLGDNRAVDPLIEALSDDDSDVRDAAVKALGRLGDKRAVDPLIKALSDKDWHVRRSTAEALGRLGDKRAVDPLIKALAGDGYDVRNAAAKALGQLGYKKREKKGRYKKRKKKGRYKK